MSRKRFNEFQQNNGRYLAHNAEGHLTFLAPSEWQLEHTMEKWPEVTFYKTMEHG